MSNEVRFISLFFSSLLSTINENISQSKFKPKNQFNWTDRSRSIGFYWSICYRLPPNSGNTNSFEFDWSDQRVTLSHRHIQMNCSIGQLCASILIRTIESIEHAELTIGARRYLLFSLHHVIASMVALNEMKVTKRQYLPLIENIVRMRTLRSIRVIFIYAVLAPATCFLVPSQSFETRFTLPARQSVLSKGTYVQNFRPIGPMKRKVLGLVGIKS